MKRMTKRIVTMLMVLGMTGMFLLGCGASKENTKEETSTSEYPQIVYIDNVSYYNTAQKCDMVPKKMPEGTIETFVSPEIMPDAYNSANFGSEYGTLSYMFLDDGTLIVQIGEDWYNFETK